jgi:hypothetical protein
MKSAHQVKALISHGFVYEIPLLKGNIKMFRLIMLAIVRHEHITRYGEDKNSFLFQ